MLHTDRHFPASFFSGNPSLREMVKDKGEFDRRLDDIDKRQRERRMNQDARDESSSNRLDNVRGSPPTVYSPYNSREFKQSFGTHQDDNSSGHNLSSRRRVSLSPQRTSIDWPAYRISTRQNSSVSSSASYSSKDNVRKNEPYLVRDRAYRPAYTLSDNLNKPSNILGTYTSYSCGLSSPSFRYGDSGQKAISLRGRSLTPSRFESLSSVMPSSHQWSNTSNQLTSPGRSFYRSSTPSSFTSTRSTTLTSTAATPPVIKVKSSTPSSFASGPATEDRMMQRPKFVTSLEEFGRQEQLHTDRNFSKEFLAQSTPLSSMIKQSKC